MTVSRRPLWRRIDSAYWRFRAFVLRGGARVLLPLLRPATHQHNDFFYRRLGVEKDAVESLCAQLFPQIGAAWDPDQVSFHYRAFAALKLSGFSPTNILELGTFQGYATLFLATLFPSATIYTVDLPDHDPLFTKFQAPDPEQRRAIDSRLSAPNIRPIRANTAFLGEMGLPSGFDLIWLDAGHEFPEVAWDHFFCLERLASNGWLFSDDVRRPGNIAFAGRSGYLDAYTVLDYFDQRRTQKFGFVLKRNDPVSYMVDRKYIAFFHKSRSQDVGHGQTARLHSVG